MDTLYVTDFRVQYVFCALQVRTFQLGPCIDALASLEKVEIVQVVVCPMYNFPSQAVAIIRHAYCID